MVNVFSPLTQVFLEVMVTNINLNCKPQYMFLVACDRS